MFLNLQSIRAKIQFRDRWLCFSVSVCTYASVSPGAWIFRRAVTVYWVSHEEKAAEMYGKRGVRRTVESNSVSPVLVQGLMPSTV